MAFIEDEPSKSKDELSKSKDEPSESEVNDSKTFESAESESKESEAERRAEKVMKAAEQGDATAQLNLGNMYYKGGGGVKQNYTEALKWYLEAASTCPFSAAFVSHRNASA